MGTFGIVTYAQVDPDSRGAVKGDAAVVRGPWSVSRRAARAGDSNLPSLSGTGQQPRAAVSSRKNALPLTPEPPSGTLVVLS